MGGFAAIVAALVPAVGTIVKDISDAFGKGAGTGSTVSADGKDGQMPTSDPAKTIANDNNFTQAVGKKHPNDAANAAANAISKNVPVKPITDGANAALTSSGKVASSLSKQLKTVAALLKPCYQAEDCIYLIREILSKPELDELDKTSIKNQWATANQNLRLLSSDQVALLTDDSTQIPFQTVVDAMTNPIYAEIDTGIKSLDDSVSEQIQTNINDLWLWLDAATQAGRVTITSIAEGLDQIAATNSAPQAKAANTD